VDRQRRRRLSVWTSDPITSHISQENEVTRRYQGALLVGQTLLDPPLFAEWVPTRPSQNNPERVARWEHWRAVVGDNIRSLRVARGMTQEALALKSGVTRNVLIDVEHGRRGLLYERLFDIAEALDVEVDGLLKRPALSLRRRRR
jgi:DNA-binding XRE family transcriptional regulator